MQDWKQRFKSEDYELLDIFRTDKGTLSFNIKCINNHITVVSRSKWDTGGRCSICEKNKEYRSLAQAAGYEYLRFEKTKAGNRLFMLCPNKHEHSTVIGNWNQGYRCSQCNQVSWDLIKVSALFASEGYKLLSTEYKNARIPLQFQCPNGHQHQIALNTWQNGIRCGYCTRSYLPKDIAQQLKAKGITLLSTPENACDRMHLKWDNCNHERKVIYYEFATQGSTCPLCLRDTKRQEEIIKYIEAAGYKYSIVAYQGAHDHLVLTCPKRHKFKITWTNFQQGHRCPTCARRTSRVQHELSKIFRDKGFLIRDNDRKQIYPKEIDIFFTNEKIGIEYCGLYWHNDTKIANSYHYNKMIECNKKGIRLITIFEDEWLNHKDICLSRINHILGIDTNKIPARKCEVRLIATDIARKFLEKNHLQGAGKAKVYFGLFYKDELLQVMSGGSPNRQHTSQSKTLEMKRLASKIGYSITGGAGKLFKQLKAYAVNNNYCQIKSYCDMRWGTGNLYKQLGFVCASSTKYTPHYVKAGKRVRSQTMKKPLGIKVKGTTWRTSLGYDTIYDCGHQTWVYSL